MPQLDVVGFYPQWVWFMLSFGVLYVSLLKGVLPKLSRVLKYRELRQEAGASQVAKFPTPKDASSARSVAHCAQILTRCLERSRTWETRTWMDLSQGVLAPAQDAYLSWMLQQGWRQTWRRAVGPMCSLEVSSAPSLGAHWTARTLQILETQ